MPDRLGADHWRERAKEARVQASQMQDADARRNMREIAENYEQLAEQAERIRKTHATPIGP